MTALKPIQSLSLRRRFNAGVSLIELMVAITIGAVLIFGATQIYVDSKNTYEVNESVARLQETGRYALSVLEADLRMANYWGLIKSAAYFPNEDKADAGDPSAGGPDTCGTNFARNLDISIEGANNDYTLDCAAFGDGEVASADTITVRRAETTTSAADDDVLQICSNRLNARIRAAGEVCAAEPDGRLSDLVVNTYYVSRDSTQADGLPSLRRKSLVSGPVFQDVEIIPGIEDLQVQFGISNSLTSADAVQYVNPGEVPVTAQVVSVRLWLLVRSETSEVGFVDDRSYGYADRLNAAVAALTDDAADGAMYAPSDGFRRLVISRTIQLRNAFGTGI